MARGGTSGKDNLVDHFPDRVWTTPDHSADVPAPAPEGRTKACSVCNGRGRIVPHAEPTYLIDLPGGGFEVDPVQIARSPLCSACGGSGRKAVRVLTDDERRRIREEYASFGKGTHARARFGRAVTLDQLAARYDVSVSTIRSIVKH
jgi:hypothetical protein